MDMADNAYIGWHFCSTGLQCGDFVAHIFALWGAHKMKFAPLSAPHIGSWVAMGRGRDTFILQQSVFMVDDWVIVVQAVHLQIRLAFSQAISDMKRMKSNLFWAGGCIDPLISVKGSPLMVTLMQLPRNSSESTSLWVLERIHRISISINFLQMH